MLYSTPSPGHLSNQGRYITTPHGGQIREVHCGWTDQPTAPGYVVSIQLLREILHVVNGRMLPQNFLKVQGKLQEVRGEE